MSHINPTSQLRNRNRNHQYTDDDILDSNESNRVTFHDDNIVDDVDEKRYNQPVVETSSLSIMAISNEDIALSISQITKWDMEIKTDSWASEKTQKWCINNRYQVFKPLKQTFTLLESSQIVPYRHPNASPLIFKFVPEPNASGSLYSRQLLLGIATIAIIIVPILEKSSMFVPSIVCAVLVTILTILIEVANTYLTYMIRTELLTILNYRFSMNGISIFNSLENLHADMYTTATCLFDELLSTGNCITLLDIDNVRTIIEILYEKNPIRISPVIRIGYPMKCAKIDVNTSNGIIWTIVSFIVYSFVLFSPLWFGFWTSKEYYYVSIIYGILLLVIMLWILYKDVTFCSMHLRHIIWAYVRSCCRSQAIYRISLFSGNDLKTSSKFNDQGTLFISNMNNFVSNSLHNTTN